MGIKLHVNICALFYASTFNCTHRYTKTYRAVSIIPNPNAKPTNVLPLRLFQILVLGIEIQRLNLGFFGLG